MPDGCLINIRHRIEKGKVLKKMDVFEMLSPDLTRLISGAPITGTKLRLCLLF